MKSSDLLDPVWQTYKVCRDCLVVARRSVKANDPALVAKTGFMSVSVSDAEQQIGIGVEEIEDVAILGFWARFERYLIEYSQAVAESLSAANPVSFPGSLQTKVSKDIEYWRIEEILDLFKSLVDPELIGRAKQIKDYRDWLAHRNPRKLPAAKVNAKTTYRILSEFVDRIESVTSPGTP